MQHVSPALSRRTFLAFASALLAKAQDTNFSTDVRVVNVLATVREKGNGGKIVNDLAKDDFVLTEDGRPQVIKYFSRESDLPLILGLLVDTSQSQRMVIGDEKSASYRFLERILRQDKDLSFLIHFDRDVELLQDVTPSRPKMEQAIDHIAIDQQDQPQMRRSGGGGGYGAGRSGGGRRGGGTALYDAILLASNEIMKNQQGRKALILLTDGVDNGSKVPLSQAVEAAQRADTLVYSIYFTGEEHQSPLGGFGGPGMGGGRRGGMGRYPQPQAQRPDGKKILERISGETGGGFFEVTKKMPIDDIFDRISDELRNQYSIGYTSDSSDTGYAFRKITLTAKRKNLVVQTREGYYPRS